MANGDQATVKRSAPLRRGQAPKRHARLAPMSQRRRDEWQERQAVVEAVKRRDGEQCAGAELVPEIPCSGPLDGDEVVPRGVRPGGHLDPENVQLLCRYGHHRYKTEHPEEAHERGLRRWSWEG